MSRLLVIPAAGRGSRLGGDTPKPFVRVAGMSMLDRLRVLYAPLVEATVVVAHPSFASGMREWASRGMQTTVVEQQAPTGMLDAILLARDIVRNVRPDEVWITWADQIGVLPSTLHRLATLLAAHQPALALPTVATSDPYTHFDRDASGRIVRLRQRREGDAMPAAGESDMGVFAMPFATFDNYLPAYAAQVAAGTHTGERNFVPFVPWLASRAAVLTCACTDPMEALGVNTPEDLARMADWLTSRDARA